MKRSMGETPSERLRKRLEELGFKKAADAARQFGWKLSTYNSHENNSRGTGIPKEAAKLYAEAYKVTLDWLYTGVGHTQPVSDSRFLSLVRRVPLVPLAKIKSVIKNEESVFDIRELPVAPAKPLGKNAFALLIEDDAMLSASGKSFPRGNIAVFDPGAELRPGDFCLAEVSGEELPVFRRYTKEAVDVERLEPLNRAYPTYWIKEGSPGKTLARLAMRVDEH
ncbi:MAG: LexA family transcriptional regulator [Rhodomicrobium sp.]